MTRYGLPATLGCAALLLSVPVACLGADIEDLGVAVRAVVFGNSQASLAASPGGRAGMFYMPYFSTTGGALVGIHPDSGEHIDIPLPSKGGYGVAVGADGAVYVGGVHPGNLYRFDPSTSQLENLGGSQFGGSYIWACSTSPDRKKIYAACYPTAGVLEYDTQHRRMRYLGRMDQKEQYARSICTDEEGKVWIGIGTHADLVVWDPRTETSQAVLPGTYKHNSCCYSVEASGGYVFAELLYDHKHPIYNSTTKEIVTVLDAPPDGLAYMTARGGHDGCFYLSASLSGTLYRYQVGDSEPKPLVPGLGQTAIVREDRYAYAIDDQDFVYYDMVDKKELLRRRMTQAKDGMALQTLASGPDGKVYGSTYINMHMFAVEPEDGRIRDLGKVVRWGGQVDSMRAGRDGKICMGSYAYAVISVYDPTQPWKVGTGADCNPREIGPLGSGQYRTRCITLGPDGMIYVGSIPSYNSDPSGAFSRVNPRTGEVRTWQDLVPGGAVNHLAVDERYVYAAGGGKFFVFDPALARVVLTIDLPVSAMVLAPSGQIVGTGGGRLFVFSPSSMELTHTAANPLGDFSHLTRTPEGGLFGINAKWIGRILPDGQPAGQEVRQVAAEGGKFLAADGQGRLYFGRGSRVFRLTLDTD